MMMPFAPPLGFFNQPTGSVVINKRKPVGDMQSGTDRRVLKGDAFVAGEFRKTTETL